MIRRTSKNLTDFYDHPEDRESSVSQTLVVVTSQLAGLILIGIGLASLKTPTWPINKFYIGSAAFITGAAFLGLWACYCWGDRLLPRLRQLKNKHYKITLIACSRRNTKLVQGTFALILADTALMTVIIIITGGIGSPLDPLLAAIPLIAIATKQPYRTIAWSLGIALFLVLSLAIIHATHPIVGPWIYDAHLDPRFHGIFDAMVISVTLLSIIEYWFSHETPPILAGIKETVEGVLNRLRLEVVAPDLAKSIARGTKDWIIWLSNRGQPLKDLSVVHDEQDVIQQAVVLCVPYWIDEPTPAPSRFAFVEWAISALMFGGLWLLRLHKRVRPCTDIVDDWRAAIRRSTAPVRRWKDRRRKMRIARNVTFLTLAAHWIDDHFDALEEHCPDVLTRQRILRESPDQLLNRGLLPRLNEVLSGMEQRANKQNRKQVRNAVKRIIYGGLVQNAPSHKRLKELRNEYVEFITENLFGEQKEVYRKLAKSRRPLTILLTAKVVMELLDSCSLKTDSAKLIKEAEFINLLYCPILYYHDWDEELIYEQYGNAFGDNDEIERHLPTVSDLVHMIKSCESLLPIVFQGSELSKGRCAQLRLLLELYEGHLPPQLAHAYKQFLDVATPRTVVADDSRSPISSLTDGRSTKDKTHFAKQKELLDNPFGEGSEPDQGPPTQESVA